MANNFSQDSYCKALWRFESGALTADSKGGNTLNPGASAPTENTTNYKEGACSVRFTSANSQYYRIADGSLDAGFPLKSGDTTKKITVAYWYRPISFPTGNCAVFSKYDSSVGKRGLFLGHYNSPTCRPFLIWGYNNGASTYTWDPLGSSQYVANYWYHHVWIIDGVAKTAKLIFYSEYSSQRTSYNTSFGNELYVSDVALLLSAVNDGSKTGYIDANADEMVVFNRLLSDDEADAIREGTFGGVVRDLTTTISGVFATGTPVAAITRPLASTPAAVITVANLSLAVTRPLQSAVAGVSNITDPSMLVLRSLISAISGVSDTGSPILAVERPLSSSLDVISALATPNLAVQRNLATLAEVMSALSDIELSTQSIYELVTAIAAQSQVQGALVVTRDLASAIETQSQVSAAILGILRLLTTGIASDSQVPDVVLRVYRDLVTAIAGESTLSDADMILLSLLITAVQVTTDASGSLEVLRDLATTIAAITAVPGFDLSLGLPRDLVTAIAAHTQLSDIEVILTFHESLLAKALRWLAAEPMTDLRERAAQWLAEEEEREKNQ